MNHDWAESEAGCIGKFASTRGNLYYRIVFWLIVEIISLAGFFYTLILEPAAPVGSSLRSVLSTVTPLLCLLSVIPPTLMIINCIRLLKPREVICVYKEGFAVKSTRGDLRSAYNWQEIHSMDGDTSYGNASPLLHGVVAALTTFALLFLLPIAVELGFTGRVLEINTMNGKRYVVDRRFPKRRELASLMKNASSAAFADNHKAKVI